MGVATVGGGDEEKGKKNYRRQNEPACKQDVKNVLFYNGLSIIIYRVSETGREIITDISVSTDEYKLKWGLSVGCTQDELKKQLGEPYEENNNTYVYQTDEAPSIVVFYIRNSNVYRIDWEFYYD